MLNTQEVLKEGEKRKIRSPEAWFIQTCSAQKLHMSFSEGRHNENCLIQEGALLFCEQAVVAPVSGDLVFRPLKIEVLSKLLAFIDGAGLVDTTYAESDKWVLLSPEFRAIWQDRKRCEYWFLQQIITPSPAFNKVLALLRKSESYWLVGYLLAQSTSGNTMENAGRRLWRFLYPFSSFVQQSVGRKSEE
ncbi:invasion protein [Salmonella enterica subsp. enterica]|uniref:Invasion protein n=1 Tax=Salmonella enterica I TaxID=59201 RepID=A0A379WMM9_SALET|nr:invasion protein [Salmonella enterica subsp. enterica]